MKKHGTAVVMGPGVIDSDGADIFTNVPGDFSMGSSPEICDLLEEFMNAGSASERWITVEEIRTFFHLEKNSSHVITGILRRLYKNRTFGYPYRVVRMEKFIETGPPYRVFTRYLIRRRPAAHQKMRPDAGRIAVPYQ